MIAIPDTILNLDSFQPHIINISQIPSALFMFISIVNKFDMDGSKSFFSSYICLKYFQKFQYPTQMF